MYEKVDQRSLSHHRNVHTEKNIEQGNKQQQAFGVFFALPGSNYRLMARPAPAFGSYITNRDLRVWMRSYCFIILFVESTPCSGR